MVVDPTNEDGGLRGVVGAVLKELSQKEIEDPIMESDAKLDLENRIAMAAGFSTDFDAKELGTPSGYTCPECNGSLTAISEGHLRCRVGHAWTVDALLAARDDEVEGAVWVALRSPQEKVNLARKMADQARPGPASRHYSTLAEESERALGLLSDRLAANAPHRGDAGG